VRTFRRLSPKSVSVHSGMSGEQETIVFAIREVDILIREKI
jgi:hypothetical protein